MQFSNTEILSGAPEQVKQGTEQPKENPLMKYKDSKVVDTSGSKSASLGFQENESLMGKAVLAGAAISPETSELLLSDPKHRVWLSSTAIKALETINSSPEDLEKMSKLPYSERYKYISDRKKDLIAEYYADVLPQEGWRTAGALGRAALDPSTLLPAGQTFKAGAAIGASVMGADSILNQKFENGEIDAKGVIMATAFGGLLGGTIAKGGKVLSDWLDSRAAEGLPVSEDEVVGLLEYAGKYGGDPSISNTNVAELTREINTKFNLSQATELKKAVSDANKILEGDLETPMPIESILEKMSKEKNLGIVKDSSVYKMARDISNIELATPSTIKVPDQTRVGKSKGKSTFTVKGGVWESKAAPREASEASVRRTELLKAVEESIPTGPDGNPSESFIKALGGIDEKIKTTSTPNEAATKTVLEQSMPWKNSAVGHKLYAEVGKMSKDISKITEDEARRIIEGSFETNPLIRPTTFLRKLGTAGREIAEGIRKGYEVTSMRVSDHLKTVELTTKAAAKASGMSTKDVGKSISRVMKGIEYPENITPSIRAAATKFRNILNESIDEYEELGLISAKKAAALRADKNYFPRVWDTVKLNEKAGRDQFIKDVMDYKWSENQINRTLKSLMGEKFHRAGNVIKQPDGSYRLISKAIADKIYASKDRGAGKKLSSHMERERTIDLPEKLIEPYLITSPESVMERYLQDNIKRAEFAKRFGNNGEVIAKYKVDLNKATGRDTIGNKVESVYRHVVGDATDAQVARGIEFMSRPSALKTTISVVNSLETLKLLFAPYANAFQATVAGSVYLTKQSDSFLKTTKLLSKSIHKTITGYKASSEAAERAGAAFEQTIMQTNADLGANYQKGTTLFLKATGFVAVEKVQRTLGYNLGKAFVEDLLNSKQALIGKISKQGPSKAYTKQLNKINNSLEEMGIDTKIANLGDIPVYEMKRAAQRFSNTINFVRDVDQLPLWAQHPVAGIFTKFKTFSYWWGGLIHENALMPAWKYVASAGTEGSLKPLIALGVVGSASGYAIEDVRERAKDFIRTISGGTKKPEKAKTALRVWADGFATVGGLGLHYDILRTSHDYGAGFAMGSLVGPGPSDVIKAGTEIAKGVTGIVSEGDFDNAGRRVVRAGSFFTPPVISNSIREAVAKPSAVSRGRGKRDYRQNSRQGTQK